MAGFRALAWNVENNLGNPKRAGEILGLVAQHHPDIAFFSEATDGRDVVSSAAQIADVLGYWSVQPEYRDPDGRKDTHRYYMMGNPEVFKAPQVVTAAGRGALVAATKDSQASFVGVHAYDRDQFGKNRHDALRLHQMRELVSCVQPLPAESLVIGGDLNSMSPRTLRAQALSLLGPLAYRMPAKNPGEIQTKLERIGSLANRLTHMALGSSIAYLQGEGFTDANTELRGTKWLGPLGVDLDHFLGRNVQFGNFSVFPSRGLSDHDGIVVDVSY